MEQVSSAVEGEVFPKVWIPPGEMFEGTHYLLRKPVTWVKDRATVILVHGIGSYFASFNHVADLILEAGYSTLQYDFYGRGFSAASPNGKYDEQVHLDQLEKLLSYLRERKEVTEKVHLAGHSMGGAFVALYTAKFPDSILSLTLCTPAGLMKSFALNTLGWFSPIQSLLKPIIIGKSQMIRATHRDFHLSHGIYLERKEEFLRQMNLQAENNPHIFDSMWKCLFEFPLNDISDRVESLARYPHLRVLVLWAQFDQMIPMSFNLRQWETLLDRGECRWRSSVVDDTGHMFIIERYEKVAEEILTVIREAETMNDPPVEMENVSIQEADMDYRLPEST